MLQILWHRMLSQSEQFSLTLQQPGDVRPGQEAQCVVTTDTVFTPQVRPPVHFLLGLGHCPMDTSIWVLNTILYQVKFTLVFFLSGSVLYQAGNLKED